jgi:hypothetical protein
LCNRLTDVADAVHRNGQEGERELVNADEESEPECSQSEQPV